LFGLC